MPGVRAGQPDGVEQGDQEDLPGGALGLGGGADQQVGQPEVEQDPDGEDADRDAPRAAFDPGREGRPQPEHGDQQGQRDRQVDRRHHPPVDVGERDRRHRAVLQGEDEAGDVGRHPDHLEDGDHHQREAFALADRGGEQTQADDRDE
ncbi:hypothetical protein SDC9_70889 [bioreactor metagenome]|uniref:Uncharacterized protein n=1 Tax=bioreactor metagenome TaxID=1076179 RepID=A0A644Y8A9_9ZZZZ